MNNFEKLKDGEGNVAVLVSPGYGAGWSTWACIGNEEQMAFDSRLVKAKLEGKTKKEIEGLMKEIGLEHEYLGGWADVEVKWVPEGTVFCIHEYDGYETLMTPEDMGVYIA